jgi:hypothetical protein
MFDAQRFSVSTTEVVDDFAAVCWSVVDEQQHAVPSREHFLEKRHEFSLSFAFRKRVDEASLASCTKHVGARIFMIDDHDGLAAASCPAACDEWD